MYSPSFGTNDTSSPLFRDMLLSVCGIWNSAHSSCPRPNGAGIRFWTFWISRRWRCTTPAPSEHIFRAPCICTLELGEKRHYNWLVRKMLPALGSYKHNTGPSCRDRPACSGTCCSTLVCWNVSAAKRGSHPLSGCCRLLQMGDSGLDGNCYLIGKLAKYIGLFSVR
jgi:hypothetical protein